MVAEPARTASGRPISVMVNVDDPDAVPDDLLRAGDGVGLLRTEFLFIGQAERPDEETQYRAYARLLQRLGGRPLILRTLDIGGDKPLPDLDIPAETNPFLGLRGLRLCLDRPELFRPQVRAALRAAADGPLSIMLPMVSRAAEVLEARSFIEAEARALDLAVPPVGIMVETPAAALALDTMPVDFASIGSNDLTQYVMAASRDAGGRVAELIDPLDPAVLRLIRMVRGGDGGGQGAAALALRRHGERPGGHRGARRHRDRARFGGTGGARPGQAVDCRLRRPGSRAAVRAPERLRAAIAAAPQACSSTGASASKASISASSRAASGDPGAA
ncbi:MAG: putative PEP-binding protein [Geminicoccaceae bacterium]